MTILPCSKFSFILSVSILSISLFAWTPFVFIPAWYPVKDIASYPKDWIAIASKDIDICSPVDKSISNSLLSGFVSISLAKSTSLFVVFPIAETTTTTSFPFSFSSITFFATDFIFSILPIDVPPYLWTIVLKNNTPFFIIIYVMLNPLYWLLFFLIYNKKIIKLIFYYKINSIIFYSANFPLLMCSILSNLVTHLN